MDMKMWLGERREWLGCDIETSGLNLGTDVGRLFQLGDERHGWALAWDEWAGPLKTVVPQYDGKIAFWNAAFDQAFLTRDGMPIKQRLVHDGMIKAHLIEPRRAIGLKPISAKLIGPQALLGKDALSEVFHNTGWDWGTIPIDHPAYWQYSALDTMLTAAVMPDLTRDAMPYHDIYEIEMACIHVLVGARLRGLRVDMEYVEKTRSRLLVDLERLRALVPIDPNKDVQVKEYITSLGVKNGRSPVLAEWWPFRTEKGDVSVDDDALKAFESEFSEVIPLLREYRTKSRVVSSYLNNLRKNVDKDDRVHPHIKQVGARHGRMSVTDPALQTLPRGRLVRDAFIAEDGMKMLLADYSQMEARVFASYAECGPMIESFRAGVDQHTWVASLAYHAGDETLVTKQERQVAKNVGFANIYGAGEAKIAVTAGVSTDVIHDFLERYNGLFPEIAKFKQTLLAEATRRLREEGDGYVFTRLGRRVPLDADKLFTAFNYLSSGSATGDVLKLKIVELDAAGIGEYIRLPVHDEIVMQVPDDEIDGVREVVERVMPETQLFSCPLAIESDVVERWGEHYEEDSAKRGHWKDDGWHGPSGREPTS